MSTDVEAARGRWAALALVLALAFAFLGLRGLFDPDEGRYTNVALNMVESGDWLNPRRSEDVGHWTKPPLTYWAIGASFRVLGPTPFAARVPSALAYLACIALVAGLARRTGRARPRDAALMYATMLLPFAASQTITTDFLLTAFETLAIYAFARARLDTGAQAGVHAARWITLMWAAFGLAFLTKGPPALLPLLAVVGFDTLVSRQAHRALRVVGLAVFALLALPWYVAVIRGHPGLLEYFLGKEVVNRVAGNEFNRHGEWYGWLLIYLPTLLVGSLPWTVHLLRGARALPARLRGWRDRAARQADAPRLLLMLWLWLPLLVFCISRSRLPLYLLPLFAPLALWLADERARRTDAPLPWRALLPWALLLLGLKLLGAWWPSSDNAERWANALRARAAGPVSEVIFVDDVVRYGLHLEMGRHIGIERISLDDLVQPAFNPDFDESLREELAEHEDDAVWICRADAWPALRTRLLAAGARVQPLGAPFEKRIMFRVQAPRPAAPPAGPATGQ